MSTTRPLYRKMINSGRWLRLRSTVMRRQRGLCDDCLAQGKVSFAQCVHHIRPVEWAKTPEEMELRMFDPSNVVALCESCHKVRHYELNLKRCGRRPSGIEKEYEAKKMLDNQLGPAPGTPR